MFTKKSQISKENHVEMEKYFICGVPNGDNKPSYYSNKEYSEGSKVELKIEENQLNIRLFFEGELLGSVSPSNSRERNLKTLKEASNIDGQVVLNIDQIADQILLMNELKLLLEKDNLQELKIYKILPIKRGNHTIVIVKAVVKVKQEKKKDNLNLSELVKHMVEDNVLTKEEIAERITFLMKSNVSDKVIIETLKRIRSIESYQGFENLIPKTNPLYRDEDSFILQSLAFSLNGNNLLYQGDKAVGKNVLANTIAWIYRRPIATLSLSSNTTLEDLVGDKTLTEGNVQFDLEILPQLVLHGGIIVLDEINTADPSLMTALHTLLDKQRQIYISSYGLIKAHEDFFAIATQNPDYMGTSENNEATKSRFVSFNFPKLINIETILLDAVPNADKLLVSRIQLIFNRLNALVENGSIDNSVFNVRNLIAGLETITKYDLPLKKVFERVLIDETTDEFERSSLTKLLDGIFG